MSRNILKKGYALRCWNRGQQSTPVEITGAFVAQTPQSGCWRGCHHFDAHRRAERFEIMREDMVLTALKKGATWIDMSSTKPKEAHDQAEILSPKGLNHLDPLCQVERRCRSRKSSLWLAVIRKH